MGAYDKTGSEAYTSIDEKCYLKKLEKPSIMELVRPGGKTILDYGCGSGKYSRWMRQAGAQSVMGVDPEEAQIKIARKQEAEQPLGIDYRVIDPNEPGHLGEFDIVIAVWVVIVAETAQQVERFFRIAHDNLRPGGQYVMWTSLVPDDTAGRERFIEAYGWDGIGFRIEPGSTDPVETTITFDAFETRNYFYELETYQRLLGAAGFSSSRFVPAKAFPAAADCAPARGFPAGADWHRFAADTGMGAVVATKG